MAEHDHDLIPPRAPPRRRYGWAIPIIVLAIAVSVFYFLNNSEKTRLRALLDEGVQVSAEDRRFVFFNRSWEYFQGKYVLSGDLVMHANSEHTALEANTNLYRALCGEILTKVAGMRDAPAGRNHVFRLALSFPIFDAGAPTGETYGPAINNIPIDDGACPNLEATHPIGINTYPGVLRPWALQGFDEYSANLPDSPEIAAAFALQTGPVVQPIPFAEACQAALFDFDRLVPIAEKRPDKLAILLLVEASSETEMAMGETGLLQHFSTEDGSCIATSEIFQMHRK